MPKDRRSHKPGDPVTEKPVLMVNPSFEGSGPAAYLHWKSGVYGLGIERPVDFTLLLGSDTRNSLDENFRVMFVGQVRDWPFPAANPLDIARDFHNGLDSWAVIAVNGARVKVKHGHAEPTLFKAELHVEPSEFHREIAPVQFLDSSVLEQERARAKLAYERNKNRRP